MPPDLERATSRDALEKQLMTNVLTIALDHIGYAESGLAYFDQSIVHSEHKAKAGSTKPTPAPPHP